MDRASALLIQLSRDAQATRGTRLPTLRRGVRLAPRDAKQAPPAPSKENQERLRSLLKRRHSAQAELLVSDQSISELEPEPESEPEPKHQRSTRRSAIRGYDAQLIKRCLNCHLRTDNQLCDTCMNTYSEEKATCAVCQKQILLNAFPKLLRYRSMASKICIACSETHVAVDTYRASYAHHMGLPTCIGCRRYKVTMVDRKCFRCAKRVASAAITTAYPALASLGRRPMEINEENDSTEEDNQ